MSKLKIVKQLINLLPDTNEKKWIIDGGCHVGEFALAAMNEFPAANILSFEPDPDSWASAQHNIGSCERVEIVRAALGAENGKAEFFRGPYSATNSLLPRPKSTFKAYYPEHAFLNGGYFVDVVTVDNECEKRAIKQLDLLKMDLQGGEMSALQGAKSLLESGAIKVILTEAVFIEKYQDQPLLWEIWRNLEAYGYSLYSLVEVKVGLYHTENASLRHGQWNQCDAIFISSPIRRAMDLHQG